MQRFCEQKYQTGPQHFFVFNAMQITHGSFYRITLAKAGLVMSPIRLSVLLSATLLGYLSMGDFLQENVNKNYL